MKALSTVMVSCLLAISALAGLDPEPDGMGVYFDTAGNSNGAQIGPFSPFDVYLLLANPTAPVDGFECTVTPLGAPHFILATDLGLGALDVDASVNGFAVGTTTPYPMAQIMRLVTWRFMLQAPAPLYWFITEATVPSLSGELPVVTGDGVSRLCSLPSGSVELPVACVNMGCFADETASFGAVKSLFR